MNLIAVDKYIEMKNKTKILDTSCPIYAVIVSFYFVCYRTQTFIDVTYYASNG